MQTVTMEIRVPKELLSFGVGEEQVVREVPKWLVISLFRSGRVSSGKAANLLGMARRDFLELLDREGIAYLDYSKGELEEEFASVRELAPVRDTE